MSIENNNFILHKVPEDFRLPQEKHQARRPLPNEWPLFKEVVFKQAERIAKKASIRYPI